MSISEIQPQTPSYGNRRDARGRSTTSVISSYVRPPRLVAPRRGSINCQLNDLFSFSFFWLNGMAKWAKGHVVGADLRASYGVGAVALMASPLLFHHASPARPPCCVHRRHSITDGPAATPGAWSKVRIHHQPHSSWHSVCVCVCVCYRSNGMMILRKSGHPEVSRHALFLTLLPRVYANLRRRYPTFHWPATLSSSALLYLVKPYLRRTMVIYAAVAALFNYKRDALIRKKLPPLWTLNLVGNAWLLWAFLFHAGSFPGGYGQVILQVSVCLHDDHSPPPTT